MANVQPSRSRSVMATFKGSAWGTGLLHRARVQCLRKGWTPESPERRLHPGGPPLYVAWGSYGRQSDYNALLNDTVFCPQPAGSTGEMDLLYHCVLVSLLNRHLRLDYARYRCNVRWMYTSFHRTCHALCLPRHAGLGQIISTD